MIDKPEDASEKDMGTILVVCAIIGLGLFAFAVGIWIGFDIGHAIFGSKG